MIVVHLSDLHLGHRAFSRSERGQNVREQDLAVAFQRAVEATVAEAPDLVLVSGDVFDRPDPPPRCRPKDRKRRFPPFPEGP